MILFRFKFCLIYMQCVILLSLLSTWIDRIISYQQTLPHFCGNLGHGRNKGGEIKSSSLRTIPLDTLIRRFWIHNRFQMHINEFAYPLPRGWAHNPSDLNSTVPCFFHSNASHLPNLQGLSDNSSLKRK